MIRIHWRAFLSHTILLCLLTLIEDTLAASVIWRCPDFNLLHCKPIPVSCVAFRMIYIRQGDMECPGCLICADRITPWAPPPPRLPPSTTTIQDVPPSPLPLPVNPKRRKKLRMKEKQRRQKQREKLRLKRQKKRDKKERKRLRKKLKKMERRNKKSNSILPPDN